MEFGKHGNTFGRDLLYGRGRRLDLDQVRAALVEEAPRVLGRDEARRQITGEERALHAAAHRLADDEHLLERDLAFLLAPQVDADRVAYGDDVDARALDDLRHLVIPDHHPDDLLSRALHRAERCQVHQIR